MRNKKSNETISGIFFTKLEIPMQFSLTSPDAIYLQYTTLP